MILVQDQDHDLIVMPKEARPAGLGSPRYPAGIKDLERSERGGRTRFCFDAGWSFCWGDWPEASQISFDDHDWRVVDVPHDWSIEGEYREDHASGPRCGFLPTGVGWYRKAFDWPGDDPGRRLVLELDGVAMVSRVYLNGTALGEQVNGFMSRAYDLTTHLRRGRNVIAVRADNSRQPAARWYTGSGIYRHTWLTITNRTHFIHNGVFVRCSAVDSSRATVAVDAEIAHAGAHAATINATVEIFDPQGRCSARDDDREITIAPHGKAILSCSLDVASPCLWSPREPNRYRLNITLRDAAGQVVDNQSVAFGIRTTAWEVRRGFLLNGDRVKLRGVCSHEDLGPLGTALNDKVLTSRLMQLKRMGCNAIRTSHHPFSPTFYDLCDQMGFMVIDEIFDGWHQKAGEDYGARFFEDRWREDVTDLVRRDRNHPCIVLWSIGNETGVSDIHGISDLIHRLDPTRRVTGGEVHEGVDVSGWNGHAGQPSFMETWKKEMPLVFTEVPHTFHTRGFYRTHTWWRDQGNPRYELDNLTEQEVFHDDFSDEHPHKVTYNSSYDNSGVRICARRSLQRTRDHDWIAGEFRWTGHDYLGESFGWPLRMGNFGIIDLCNFPKDHYFLYQSQWTDAPMLHLLPHWTHPTIPPGALIPVWAYSNCEEVELFHNNHSLGTRRPGRSWEDMACQWHVPWEPGTLRAVGRRGGQVTATAAVASAAAPAKILVESDTSELTTSPSDMAQVAVAITDARGTIVPYGDNRVHFYLQGPARLRAVGNGDPAELDRHTLTSRRAFQGRCKAFIEPTGQTGPITLWTAAILGDRSVSQDRQVSVDVRRIALRGEAAAQDYNIRMSADGGDPLRHGERYERPIVVSHGANVRGVVSVAGTPVLRMEEWFDKPTPVLGARLPSAASAKESSNL